MHPLRPRSRRTTGSRRRRLWRAGRRASAWRLIGSDRLPGHRAYERKSAGPVGDVVHEPGDGDEIDAVADERHRLADPEQAEVTVAQSAEHCASA
jgi:hypothetical protein